MKKFLKSHINKGHDRFTVMIIPHNESHIISIQLSNFIILFTIFVLGIIFLIFYITSSFETKIKKEYSQLNKEHKAIYETQSLYYSKLEEIMEHQEIFKDTIFMFKKEIADVETDNLMYSYDIIKDKANFIINNESKKINTLIQNYIEANEYNQLKKMGYLVTENQTFKNEFQYNDLVSSYRALLLHMKQLLLLFNNSADLLTSRLEIENNLPYYFPVQRGHITSRFGKRYSPFGFTTEFHFGLDLASYKGTKIYATATGRVVRASYSGGYGLSVIIQHPYGYETIYAHLSRLGVYTGKRVKQGDLIGYMGSTGRTTGSHLHYEVKLNKQNLNPISFVYPNK